jgi:hypothetical protein
MTIDLDPRPLNLNIEHWNDIVDNDYTDTALSIDLLLGQGSSVCTILDESSFLGSESVTSVSMTL